MRGHSICSVNERHSTMPDYPKLQNISRGHESKVTVEEVGEEARYREPGFAPPIEDRSNFARFPTVQTLLLFVIAATAGTAAFAFSFNNPRWMAVSVPLGGSVSSLSLRSFQLLRDGFPQDWGSASLMLNQEKDTATIELKGAAREPGTYTLRFSNEMTPVCPRFHVSAPDTSDAQHIGDGTPQSCHVGALRDALARPSASRHVLKFHCGEAPVVIQVESEIVLPVCNDCSEGESYVIIDGQGLVTLSALNRNRLFSLSTGNASRHHPLVTFQNLKLIGSPADDGQGGSIYYGIGGSVAFINCDIVGKVSAKESTNETTTNGGAINVVGGGSVHIEGCRLWGHLGGNGGAVAIHGSRRVTIYNSWVFNNSASGRGGGIYIQGGNATDIDLCGVLFMSNRAGQGGGGLAAVGDGEVDLDMRGPECAGCGTRLNLSSCLFDGNEAQSGNGGGLLAAAREVNVEGSTLTRNLAVHGSALYFERSVVNVAVRNSILAGNVVAHGSSGALHFESNLTAGKLDHLTVSENSAPPGAPGRYLLGPAVPRLLLSNSVYHEKCWETWTCWQAFGEGGRNVQAGNCGLCSPNTRINPALHVSPLRDGSFCVVPLQGSGTVADSEGVGAKCDFNLLHMAQLATYTNGELIMLEGETSFTV